MNKKYIGITILLSITNFATAQEIDYRQNYIDRKDSLMLKRISAYGKDIIEERPYIVKLCNKNLWRISGSLPSGAKQGGTFSIIIQKCDGKVIMMYHTK